MRHRVKRYQLNRRASWRKSTLNSIARSLLLNQRIKTTLTKAKASRPLIEELISLAKENTLFARRRAFAILSDHLLVKKLFTEIAPRFTKRQSGFTRIIPFGQRRGDNALLAIFELTEIKEIKKKVAKKEKKAEEIIPEKPAEERKAEEKPPMEKKPTKKFLGGIRKIFKKERDSL